MGLRFAKQTRRKSQTEETAAAGHGGITKVRATLQEQQMLQVWLQYRTHGSHPRVRLVLTCEWLLNFEIPTIKFNEKSRSGFRA